jgi:hypothetical protein
MNPPDDPEIIVLPPTRTAPGRPSGRIAAAIGLLLPGVILAGTLLLAAFWHLPLLTQTQGEFSQRLSRAAERERELRAALARLAEGERECRAQQARAQAAERRERALRELSAPLLAALAEKKIEEVAGDTAVRSAIERASPELLDLSLIDSGGQQVFVRRGGPSGTLREVLPELAAALGQDRSSPPAHQPGWHWTGVKGFNLLLAYRTVDEPAPADLPQASVPPEPSAEPPLPSLAGTLAPWHLAVAAAAGLLGLVLLFLWLDARLLRPVHQLSRYAREALNAPGQVPPAAPVRSGPAQELALSLERAHHALRRLEESDAAAEERRRSLEALVSLLEAVRRGELGQRIQDLCPELTLLGSTLNGALEEVAGRMRASQDSAARLEENARRLLALAEDAQRNLQDSADAIADPGLLADALEIQLAEIFAAVRALPAPGDRLQPEKTVLSELAQEVESLQRANQALEPFFQELASLATVLSVAAQSGTTPNLEELALSARRLTLSRQSIRDQYQLYLGRIAERQDDLSRAAEELQELRSWVQSWKQARDALLSRLEAFEPIGRGLGERVRHLVQELSARRSNQRAVRDFVSALSEAARALAAAGREIQTHLGAVQTATVLRSPSREMADHLGRLHQALERLADLAAREGIRPLRPETAEIVQRIQQSAARIQERLTQEPPPAPGGSA